MSNLAAEHLAAEREALQRELIADLRTMRRDIENAMDDVEEGSALGSDPLQHATGIATLIGRWNLCQALAPYFKDKP